MLPRVSTTISLRLGPSSLRSAWSTSEPSGSWRSSRLSGPATTSSRPSGSQSIENGMVVGTVAITSALPSRSTARICCAPQLDSHSRPSRQRADSPIFNPVSRTSVIVVTPQHRREPCHHRYERRPPGSTPTQRNLPGNAHEPPVTVGSRSAFPCLYPSGGEAEPTPRDRDG